MHSQAVIVRLRQAKVVMEKNRTESLGLKLSQIIVITRKVARRNRVIGKLVAENIEQQPYQYVLARPVNQYYLLKVLMHVIRGQELLRQQQNAVPRSPEMNPDPTTRLSILVADDNDFCKNAVVRLMQKYTTRVTACEDGMRALVVFKNTFPGFDLAILDYQMPKLDGIALIGAIRDFEAEHGNPKRVTIIRTTFDTSNIVASGDDDGEVETRAIAAGADFTSKFSCRYVWELVKKPLNSARLEEVIAKVTASKAGPREQRTQSASAPSQFYRITNPSK